MMQPPKPPQVASRTFVDRLRQRGDDQPKRRSSTLGWWRRLVRFIKAD
jgi:hypothetical protein